MPDPFAAELPLTCPVCRAKQIVADQCRRCRADLSAVNASRRSVALASLETLMQMAAGDLQNATRSVQSLRVLQPRQAQWLSQWVGLDNPPE